MAREIGVGARLLGRWAATIEPRDSHSALGEGALAELEGSGSSTLNLTAKVAGFHESWIAGIGPGRLTLVTAVAGPVEQQLSQMAKPLGCVPAVRGQPHVLHRRQA